MVKDMESLNCQEIELSHHSRQAEFAQNLMSYICGEHRLDTTCPNDLDFQYDGIRLPTMRMAIGTIRYGAPVAINTSNLRAYSISLPVQGKQVLNLRGQQHRSDTQTGLIVSNAELQDLMIDANCTKLQVVIPEQSLNLVLSNLLHRPVEKPIIFNPQMHIESEQLIAAWWKNIQNFLQLKAQYTGFYGLQMLSQDYENFVIKALLLSQENNYSNELKLLSTQSEPSYILKVRNYMIENAHRDISVEDLQRIAGVSKSKLYDEFQHYYGTSPMSYLKSYRLQQVYKILSNSGVNKKVSISQLAYEWGFNHLSRFSQEYKDEFGEKPSETRNKY